MTPPFQIQRSKLIDLMETIRHDSIHSQGNNEPLLPACQRIADSDKYHNLFMDASLSDHIIQRIAAHEREKVVPEFMKKHHLSEDKAEMLFKFTLHGTFSVNRSLGWERNGRWYRYQQIITRFLNGKI